MFDNLDLATYCLLIGAYTDMLETIYEIFKSEGVLHPIMHILWERRNHICGVLVVMFSTYVVFSLSWSRLVSKIAGLIPGHVKPKTITLVFPVKHVALKSERKVWFSQSLENVTKCAT